MLMDETNSGSDIDVYLPEFNLQGDKIPFYTTWKNKPKRIRIYIEDGLLPDAIYNVNTESLNVIGNELQITDTITKGYLSGLLVSEVDQQERMREPTVKFYFEYEKGEISFERKILLFRQDLNLSKDKNNENKYEMKISYFKGKGRKDTVEKIDGKIKLVNKGQGTAIVLITIKVNGKKQNNFPKEFEDFVKNFHNDLQEEIRGLGIKYPRFSDLLERYMIILKNPLPNLNADDFKKTLDQMDSLLVENDEFKNDFISKVSSVIMRNTGFTSLLQELVKYIRMLRPHKVISLNPFDDVILHRGENKLEITLEIIDLLYKPYDPIEINDLTVRCEKDTNISVLDLFDFTAKEVDNGILDP